MFFHTNPADGTSNVAGASKASVNVFEDLSFPQLSLRMVLSQFPTTALSLTLSGSRSKCNGFELPGSNPKEFSLSSWLWGLLGVVLCSSWKALEGASPLGLLTLLVLSE